MKQYEDLLVKLNLSPTASKVYLALLESGKLTADSVAKKAGTYKANAYDALARLEHVGLVSSVTEQRKRLFIAANPEKLHVLVDEKEHEEIMKFERIKSALREITPGLMAKYNSLKEKDLFEVYRGKKAYKVLINEIVNEGANYWKGFGNLQIYDLFPFEFERWFRKIQIKLFSTKSDAVIHRLENVKKVCKAEVKWLPQDVHMPIVWVVFGDNVLIVIYEPEIIVMRIKSRQIVETFSSQFDYLWGKYPKQSI